MKNVRKKNVTKLFKKPRYNKYHRCICKYIREYTPIIISVLSLFFGIYFSIITNNFDRTKKVIEISPILQNNIESYNKEIMYSIIENKKNNCVISDTQYETVLKLKSLLWAYIESAKVFSASKELYSKCNESFNTSWKLFNKYYSDLKVIDENDYNIFDKLNLKDNCTNFNKDIIENNVN
ncbi:hypothetical protein GCL60_16435 [Silvanigrella paludirubra]|uniref:Uncharacterized protein n=1 Tax=Silvanigrella paludirubra TaxID=2499159 RepID=A0A6N6VN80_9BACT|nr:hypothetical protein [Silvanigrella paludirubra]KAB8035816.1 hypothetical protein GCL60_16435 [Silvanigrella paludirubra]